MQSPPEVVGPLLPPDVIGGSKSLTFHSTRAAPEAAGNCLLFFVYCSVRREVTFANLGRLAALCSGVGVSLQLLLLQIYAK